MLITLYVARYSSHVAHWRKSRGEGASTKMFQVYTFSSAVLSALTLSPLHPSICHRLDTHWDILRAADLGAALFVHSGNLTVAESEFLGNIANQFGGGVGLISAGFLDVQSTTFEYNSAGSGGGAIAIGSESSVHR